MKNIFLVSAISMLFMASAYAATPAEFTDVDKNKDGVLNIDEAKAALPTLTITDTNSDGVVSKSEAENSVPGLTLSIDGQGDGSMPVGAREYQMIVLAMEGQARQRISRSN